MEKGTTNQKESRMPIASPASPLPSKPPPRISHSTHTFAPAIAVHDVTRSFPPYGPPRPPTHGRSVDQPAQQPVPVPASLAPPWLSTHPRQSIQQADAEDARWEYIIQQERLEAARSRLAALARERPSYPP